jgi:chromosome segregation protein
MRLKSLHIKGFKSFANETILNFSENVIGVVGPNGSGKSNIVDAIRWVLGEQKSKELRLESMSDIIFNGTKSKKEAATATVSLIFENDKGILPSEYNTVSIARTLYRSGESEYKLNGVSCRLKDINTLFLDTGIGSNSYAIIALGMVDDILSDKDNARRRMFEQAAGVSKYKIRKRETLSKLKSATEDLNRVDDLLFEIEGNLKSLEKQAKRTQKYLDLKAEYKELSIKHAVYSIHNLKAKYKGINEQLARDQDTYRENDTQLYTLQATLQKDKKNNTDVEITLSTQQKKLNDLVYQIRSKESEKSLLSQSLTFKKQSKDQATTNIESNSVEVSKLRLEVEHFGTRLAQEIKNEADLAIKMKTSKSNYDGIKQRYNDAKLSFDVTQRERQDIERQVFGFEKDVAISTNSKENAQRETQHIVENLSQKEKDQKNTSKDLVEFDQQYNSKEKELALLVNAENDRKGKLLGFETLREELQQKLISINRNIDSKQNEHDLLKSMIDSFEGFPESVKFLHDEWRKDVPVLSDLLDVKEEYKAAIELLLEPYLNYYVVNSVSEASQAIGLLKKSQKGKVNFFVIDQLKKATHQSISLANLIPAISVVTVADKYNDLLATLLGSWYIFDGDIEQFGLTDISQNVVSVSGTFMKTAHTMAGGSVGLFEGKKLGRKQNLEKLSKYLHENNTLKTKTEQQLEKVKLDINLVKSENQEQGIEALNKSLQIIEQERIKVRLKIQGFDQAKAEADRKIGELALTVDLMKSKIADATHQIDKLKLRLTQLDQASSTGNKDVDELNELLSSASEAFNQDNISHIRQQNLIASFQKDLEFKSVRIKDIEEKIEEDELKLKVLERERIDIEDGLVALDQSLKDLYVEKKEYQQSLNEVEQGFFQKKNAIMELEDKIASLTKIQNQLQFTIQNLKDQFTEQKFQIQSVGERLRIEFEININDVINQELDDEWTYDTLTEAVDRIKQRMQGYGDINPLAVESYNEMKIRYDSITIQRKDILDAKDSLMETIQEIETTATGQFMEAFESVRTSFIDVFRSLFTDDDTCDLILLDPSNPLDSEIEIIAKPKGKKPKSLSQLSGGEKTLTATALLFALYLLKPAPFCIFDEVDAPLDDANIQKFNRIIKKFSSDSQFIIVTHNKSTMAEVDVLYGIYMSEPGVSAVSSVDFRALKHDAILENLN